MQRFIVPVVLALVAACSAAPMTSGSVSPIVTGDTCGLNQDAVSCRTDSQAMCAWFVNTRPCLVGQPCPAGFCSQLQAADGGIGVSAGCACPGVGTDVCVMEIGGPAAPAPPPITCASVPASCTDPDHCGCLTNPTLGACVSSVQVTNLCVCDNGIR